MLSCFYPGPSKIYPEVSQYMQEAVGKGILSLNHRSTEFMHLCAETIAICKKKLAIPADYSLFFASSATECWEIIAQSFLESSDKVYHCCQGAFGEKWLNYNQKLCAYNHIKAEVQAYQSFEATKDKNPTLLCFTPSETSNGMQFSMAGLQRLRLLFPDAFFAHDVTSCLGGITLMWEVGDIWFASVQKCLGLPAGLALCIMSPRAVARAYKINERTHYNSLINNLDNISKFQTPYTPNVLGIYLLYKVMLQVPPISEIDAIICKRAEDWYKFFEQFEDYTPLASVSLRSSTIICISGTEENICFAKEKMKEQNIILGNGYSRWENNTFRIANFPAISEEEIALFKDEFMKIAKIKA